MQTTFYKFYRLLIPIFLGGGSYISAQIYNTDESHFPTVHVFGDSHIGAFITIPGCKTHGIGYNMNVIGRDKLKILDIKERGVIEGQVAVFTYGEVDVRLLIGKQRDESNRNLHEIIDPLVENYIDTVLLNRGLFDNVLCVVYSVVPPTYFAHESKQPLFYGTLEDRVVITKEMNQKLAELCAKNGIAFLDVYDDYSNPDGTLNFLLSDGGVHINPRHSKQISVKLNQILIDNSVK